MYFTGFTRMILPSDCSTILQYNSNCNCIHSGKDYDLPCDNFHESRRCPTPLFADLLQSKPHRKKTDVDTVDRNWFTPFRKIRRLSADLYAPHKYSTSTGGIISSNNFNAQFSLFIDNMFVTLLSSTVQTFTESEDTRCCVNTIFPPEDGQVNARNMSRIIV